MTETTTSFTPVPILYVNHRGEVAVRRIVPGPLWFGSTEWHPEPQWLLTADEPDTGKRRDFALAGIKAWGEAAIQNAGWRTRGEEDPHGDRYACQREELSGGHLTDDQVAFQIAMLMRSDLNHEAVLDMAKDRIRWLSRRLAAMEALASTPSTCPANTSSDPAAIDTSAAALDDEARELAVSERISAAQATYDEWMADCHPADPEYEVCAFETMKAALAAGGAP